MTVSRTLGFCSRVALGLGLSTAVAVGGWRRGALTGDGAVAAALVGAVTLSCGGIAPAVALVAFFASGSALSRRRPVAGEVTAAKGHRRDAAQVLANGGVAALAAFIGSLGWRRGHAAALGALAGAAADTWASEIGVRSRRPPRSIVSGEIVPPGLSGGVTPLGWLAATGGAITVGIAATIAEPRRGRCGRVVLGALASGLAGSLADSVAGATIQASYRCLACGMPADAPGEHCGARLRLVRGLACVTNDGVNAIGTLAGAMVGAISAGR